MDETTIMEKLSAGEDVSTLARALFDELSIDQQLEILECARRLAEGRC